MSPCPAFLWAAEASACDGTIHPRIRPPDRDGRTPAVPAGRVVSVGASPCGRHLRLQAHDRDADIQWRPQGDAPTPGAEATAKTFISSHRLLASRPQHLQI